MAKQTVRPLAAAVGAAFLASVVIAPVAAAGENPFQASELTSGYNNMTSKLVEGGCGEGSCGGDKDKEEGACGGDKDKGEGTCGGDKDKEEGSCGGDKAEDKAKKDKGKKK